MITLNNITKYFGERCVLNNINHEIQDHQLLAIKGASGSGKTTLLNIIGLLDDTYDGNVIIDGINVTKLSSKNKLTYIRENISYLFQNYALLDEETVLDNLLLALEYSKISKEKKLDKIKEILKKVKLEISLKQKVFELSGGEQQRLSLARTLLKSSKIILADEPTGNLDDENRDIILSILKDLKEASHTIIIVTHDEHVANSCDQVLHLDEY